VGMGVGNGNVKIKPYPAISISNADNSRSPTRMQNNDQGWATGPGLGHKSNAETQTSHLPPLQA